MGDAQLSYTLRYLQMLRIYANETHGLYAMLQSGRVESLDFRIALTKCHA